MAEFKILEGGITETTRMDERMRFVPVRIVRYMVGTHGPFMLQIDAKDFTSDEVTRRIEADVVHLKALGGI